MKETIDTINGQEYTRPQLLDFGKVHYPKFYWIKRGVGIGLIAIAFTTLVSTLVAFLPLEKRTENPFIVLCSFSAVFAIVGLILIAMSFQPLPDEAYIKHAEDYYRRLGAKIEKRARAEENRDVSLLVKYKELLDAGVITQEEFDVKKKELLK